ncbi:MAG: hypothetical protein JSU94_11950 [Phycisphaerales bacterium]|nr:MAG: hypothetical protein JSU94_11950 [Phycisphaerales bacterium]
MAELAVANILSSYTLALSPPEKWEAARRFGSNVVTERWLILIGLLGILVLTVLLLLDTFTRKRENKAEAKSFTDHANERGLSYRERQILLDIAAKAGLKSSESVFTMASAFDHGAVKMVQASSKGNSIAGDSRELRTELSFLREKLGYPRRLHALGGASARPRRLDTKQIPVGQGLSITRRRSRDGGDIEATVVENGQAGLSVELAAPVKVTFGEMWCVRYHSGTSVWEFDTSVASYDGSVLVLDHSDSVRFINRRRFLRVPVGRRAFIAHFPFTRVLCESENGATDFGDSGKGHSKAPAETPEFVPAVITELAGPGLRIESKLEVEVGERILVVFRLSDEGEPGPSGNRRGDKSGTYKVVEDLGEVRHVQTIEHGFSIAVELTGLKESDVDELVRETNAALLQVSGGNGDAFASASEQRSVHEPTVAEGH